MKPAAVPKKSENNQQTLAIAKRLISRYLRRYIELLVWAVIFMLMAAGMTAIAAGLMQPILDDVLYGGKHDLIIPVALAIFGTFTIRGLSTYFHTIIINKIGQSIVSDVQTDLFGNFMNLDMAFFHANPSGQLISRVVNDVTVMRSVVSDSMTNLGKNLFTLIFLIGLMFYQDWKLTLAVFAIFPILSYSVILIGKRLRKVSKNIQHEMGGLSSLLSQTFQGIRLIKAYSMEEHERQRVGYAIRKVRDLNIKSVRLSSLSGPINEAIVGIIFASIIVYGGYAVIHGDITPGGLASFLAAFGLTFEPMKRLAKLNNTMQIAFGAAERVFDMIDSNPHILQKENAAALSSKNPDIIFENVEFQYDKTDSVALKGINFTAKAGTITALVGSSGGGKSTVMSLIPRFYDVKSGTVKIAGQDVRDLSFESLRGNIALVSQDITIFDDTVLENIRYGLKSASEDDVMKAATAAAAHDFILNLPEGYQTVVGENGVLLSGGQKQRIAIARAILRDAPILLLDEATSALDNESEKLVQAALSDLEKGRTTVVIAHRLTTVQEADQIIVMDRGCIAEKGTHAELLARDGLYARMYKTGLKE